MKLPTAVLALVGFVALTSATPIVPPAPRALPHALPRKPVEARQGDLPACAKASAALYTTPRPKGNMIPAGIAYDCLLSVPLNATAAKVLLKELPKYLEWQSTLDGLKNPPAEYVAKQFPPIDILAGLQQIEDEIDSGKITGEYQFGWVLYTLIQAAHDGHLTFVPDSVGQIFTWGRPIPLVSVSADGTQLPGIFTFEDVLGMKFKNISYTPSPVVQIDGEDANQFLEAYSRYGSLQDRDALWNNMFYELAQVSLQSYGSGGGMFAGGGRARFVFPGDTTRLKFANGTEYTMQNFARLIAPHFRGISTGEDLAKVWFRYNAASVSNSVGPTLASTEATQEASAAVPGYPSPVVPGVPGQIEGYFIDAPGYEDVAVLKVTGFVTTTYQQIAFQKTTLDFVPKALAAGKTKLIIDLQANGGGSIMQGYDLFRQFFPEVEPYGANRFRYHEAADLIGQVYSAVTSKQPRQRTNSSTINSMQVSFFDYRMDMTVDGEPFGSWKQKIGPVEVNGAKYSALTRWNLKNDPLVSLVAGGINVTGYPNGPDVLASPKFKRENIVLLTDGYCASTCSIFTEFMTKQAGVKTIALGGRPNKKPIQAVGGVKGVNNYAFSYLEALAMIAVGYAPDDLQDKVNSSVLPSYTRAVVSARSALPGSLNSRDGLSQNDTSGVALQFIQQDADCRLFYTPDMTVDATAIWKTAADAQWRASGKCVNDQGVASTSESGADDQFTTTLNLGHTGMSQTGALSALEAFERSFSIQTENYVADGFMMP